MLIVNSRGFCKYKNIPLLLCMERVDLCSSRLKVFNFFKKYMRTKLPLFVVLFLFVLSFAGCSSVDQEEIPVVVVPEDSSDGQATVLSSSEFGFDEVIAEDGSFTISVLRNGVAVGTIEKEAPADGYSYSVFEVGMKNAYIEVNPTGLGGAIYYGGAYELYKIDLETNEMTQVFFEGDFATDVSVGEEYVVSFAGTIEGNMVAYLDPIADDEVEAVAYPVDAIYWQAGDGKFSPGGDKLAFSVVTEGAALQTVYVVSLDTGKTDEYWSGSINAPEDWKTIEWTDNSTPIDAE